MACNHAGRATARDMADSAITPVTKTSSTDCRDTLNTLLQHNRDLLNKEHLNIEQRPEQASSDLPSRRASAPAGAFDHARTRYCGAIARSRRSHTLSGRAGVGNHDHEVCKHLQCDLHDWISLRHGRSIGCHGSAGSIGQLPVHTGCAVSQLRIYCSGPVDRHSPACAVS